MNRRRFVEDGAGAFAIIFIVCGNTVIAAGGRYSVQREQGRRSAIDQRRFRPAGNDGQRGRDRTNRQALPAAAFPF